MLAVDQRRRLIPPVFGLSLLLGVIVHLAGFLIFRVKSNELPVQSKEDAYVSYVRLDSSGGDLDLLEQAVLFDSAPLFIPGRWSSSSSVFPTLRNFNLKVFPDFEPKMGLAEDLRPKQFEFNSRAEVREPVDLLDLQHWDLFRNFSMGEPPKFELEDWTPIAEVRVLSSSIKVSQKVVFFELPKQAALELRASFEPSVFFLSMVASGMPSGDAFLLRSSGSESIDEIARDWLRDPKTLAQLPPGFLEIRVFL